MKKLASILIIAFFILPAMFSPLLVKAEAGWVTDYFCDSTIGREKFYSDKVDVRSPDQDDAKKFHTDKILEPYCVDTKIVGSLYDFQVGQGGDTYGFCKASYTTAEDAVIEVNGSYIDYKAKDIACCPMAKHYLTSIDTGNSSKYWGVGSAIDSLWWGSENPKLCCAHPLAVKDPAKNLCGGSDAVTGVAPTSSNESKLGDAAFPAAEIRYSCPPSACFTEASKRPDPIRIIPISSDKRINLTETERLNYDCTASVDASKMDPLPTPNMDLNNYCFSGQIFTTEEFTQWKGLLGAIVACKASPDDTEVKNCLNCYKKCINQTECPESWGALGCVGTTSDTLITRVFQIGIGVVGLVGIFQVMNAAMLRQTGDPAKIQESYEIVGSLLIGMVLLLGAFVILRFIGGPLLNLLPFDFLK